MYSSTGSGLRTYIHTQTFEIVLSCLHILQDTVVLHKVDQNIVHFPHDCRSLPRRGQPWHLVHLVHQEPMEGLDVDLRCTCDGIYLHHPLGNLEWAGHCQGQSVTTCRMHKGVYVCSCNRHGQYIRQDIVWFG